MKYHQFIQAVEAEMKKKTEKHTNVSVRTVVKNNGTCRRGLLLEARDVNIAPTIYLEEYYHQFCQGESIKEIVEEIFALYQKIRFRRPWKEELLRDYGYVSGRIVYRLVGMDANKECLKEVPYVPYLDLAIVFYVLLEINGYGMASMQIQNKHLEMWNVPKEQVYRRACENTWKLLPYEFQTMDAVIEELSGSVDEYGADEMYVLSNKIRSFGAAAILYPGRLSRIGEYLGENYYVLPSSVHETIIIPESASLGKEILSDMVAEINRTEVGKEEVLSDRAYYFDRMHGKLNL